MYAVVKTGGKQYRVSKDDVIVVEKLAADTGASVELDQVLMLDDGKDALIGTPLVDGARVAATVLDQARGDKIIIFKKKRRKDYRRLKGHRQQVTILRITDILARGAKASPAKAAAPVKDEAPVEPAPTPAAAETPVEASTEAVTPEVAAPEAAAPEAAAPAKKAPAKKAAAKKTAAKKTAAKKAPAKKAAAKKTSAKKSSAKKAAPRKTEE
jgi:large subunit ribosomal protein L21